MQKAIDFLTSSGVLPRVLSAASSLASISYISIETIRPKYLTNCLNRSHFITFFLLKQLDVFQLLIENSPESENII